MRTPKLLPAILVAFLFGNGAAAAQSAGVITGGSADTMIGGKPAARVGDGTNDGPLVEGSPNVFINGKPAAVIGGRSGCGSTVVGGSSNVFINGKPVAQAGSLMSDCKGR